MSEELAKTYSTLDQFGRPRVVKSFTEVSRDVFGADFNMDIYAQNIMGQLSKALTTTTGIVTSPGNLVPIEIQNLDATMTSVLFQKQHLVLFNWLNKVPSLTPYYEWNRRLRYGSSRANRGFVEGGAPRGGTVQFQRFGSYIKYMGTKRAITHQMMLSGQLGGTQVNPVEEENRDGTLELLESVERQLMFGDANIPDQSGSPNAVNYDGFVANMVKNFPQNVIDMQGAAMDFDILENLGFNLYQKAKLTDFTQIKLFMTGQVLADLSKLRFPADRREMELQSGSHKYRTGIELAGHRTNFGVLDYEPSIFMDDVPDGQPLTTADSGAPAAFAVGAATMTPGAAPATFTSTITPGTYYYTLAACNDSGESIGVTQTGAVVVTAANPAVTLTAPSPDATASFFRVYRGVKADGSDAQWVGKVPAYAGAPLAAFNGLPFSNTAGAVGAAGGSLKFVDINFWNPAAKGLVVAIERSPENVAIAQMSPLLRWPLPLNQTQIEWLLLLYHTLVVKAPERVYIYKNVGTLT